jgi:D-aminopeptidase
VRFGRPDWCDNAAGCPGTTRIDGTTIEITAPDWVGVFARFVAAVRLAYAD